jgi:twitching motility protein PilT
MPLHLISETSSTLATGAPLPPTRVLIETLLKVADKVSDIFLSPMHPPELRISGRNVLPDLPRLWVLLPDDTCRIAADLIGNRLHVRPRLEAEGSCDFSFFLQGVGRFRVSIFSQRGSYAIALRVIYDSLPSFESLRLPDSLDRLVRLRSGLVIATGPAASGKSSTLAAVLSRISEQRAVHIVTVEDPIEFQFRHQKATVFQREIHRDVPSFSLALRSALRQPPQIILLSAIPSRETMDLVLDAADGGHLVFVALCAPDAACAVKHLLRHYSREEEHATRARLAQNLRAIVSQRLLPLKRDPGQVAAFEILFSSPHVRECVARGKDAAMTLNEIIRQGARDGMQSFEEDLKQLEKAGLIAEDARRNELSDSEHPAAGSGAKNQSRDNGSAD